MFYVIEHEIHDATKFANCVEQAFPLPEGLHFHQFVPSSDLSKAVCLYEAESLDKLREFIDGLLGSASTQRYFAVAQDQAVGLPQRQLV